MKSPGTMLCTLDEKCRLSDVLRYENEPGRAKTRWSDTVMGEEDERGELTMVPRVDGHRPLVVAQSEHIQTRIKTMRMSAYLCLA